MKENKYDAGLSDALEKKLLHMEKIQMINS